MTPEPAFQSKSTGQGHLVGTALTSRESRSEQPAPKPNAWKRASSPEAYADLIAKRGSGIEETLAGRKAGDRTSMGQYNNASKHRTQYYEDQFRYKDNEIGTARERVQRESPVIAELKTNVIIKDEFTLVTDLSYHLAQRYTRPDSSIMIKVDHSACIALGGTFDPCYILTVTALPSSMGPTVNKRNAALIQSFMADILSVPSERGIVKFQAIEECNYAFNGNTMLGEVERLEKHQGEADGVSGAMKRAITNPGRKSTPTFNKSSVPKLDTDVKAPTSGGASTPSAVTPVERKRRSTSATPPPPGASAIPNVFELAATENERPSTAHGAYAAENGLRMNGISKEDLVGAATRTPNGRPKTFSGQSPSPRDSKNEPVPQQRPSGSRQSSYRRSTPQEAPKKTNIPVSPKPERTTPSMTMPQQGRTTPSMASPQPGRATSSMTSPQSGRTTPSTSAPQPVRTTSSMTNATSHSRSDSRPPPPKNTYLDNVTTSNTNRNTERADPKLDAKAAEKNRQIESNKDTAANTAKRRSTATVTATPKMPPPPPIPQDTRRHEPKKRKSFLSAFRRSTATPGNRTDRFSDKFARMMERTALERDMQEEHEEEYDENADEDFNPDKAAGDEDASSSEDEEVAKQEAKKPQKRKAEDVEELDSGDEATIKERKRKRKKKDVAEAEESGGEGGLVRTRAQRLAEKIERKERKRGTVGEVTIDVDRIWKELNSEPIGRPPPPPPKAVDGMDVDGQQDKENTLATGELITIKRQIEYAGEVTEVEEQVLLSSNEAQRYLKKHPEADPKYKPPNPSDTLLRRPLKRPSMFEPNPTATIKGVAPERLRPRAPSRLDVLMAEKRAEEEMKKKVERMTTVQKSALDWRGFVDQQGLREELDEYGKSKQGYLAREDFLGRADMAREEAGRSARLKG